VTKNSIAVNYAFTFEAAGRRVTIVAKDPGDRDAWIDRIKARARLLEKATAEQLVKNQAGHRWVKNNREWERFPMRRPVTDGSDHDPEPEPALLDVSTEDDRALADLTVDAPPGGHQSEAKRVAQHAVDIYAHWKHTMDHLSAKQLTDDTVALLRQGIEEMEADNDWAANRDTVLRNLTGLQDRVASAVRGDELYARSGRWTRCERLYGVLGRLTRSFQSQTLT
jgi:hypothetical protein